MVKAIVEFGEHEDRVLTIVKGKFGFRNKSEALNYVIGRFEEEILEPHLRPEYLKNLEKIRKQKGRVFSSVSQLRKHVENAKVRD